MASANPDKFLLVAAIDFGTTFSGYAFSFSATKSNSELPEQIRTNKNWGAAIGFQSHKTPSSVLVNIKGEFLAFGYEAEKQYIDAEQDEDTPRHLLLFRHFKMMLHSREQLKERAVIASVDGTIMPALDIFAHSIRYLKDHLQSALNTETGSAVKAELIRWVITVPAIWIDESKDFMREAVYKAGCIPSKESGNLVIALEPEAASLCCRRLNIANYTDDKGIAFPKGTKYVVLDCGGGTIDITMHEMVTDTKVKEILCASGGPWGGTEVDKNFLRLMETVFGKDFMNTFQQHQPNEWLQVLSSFETTKKSFVPDGKSKVSICLPFTMGTLFAEKHKGKRIDKHLKECTEHGVTFANGMIVIQHEAVKKLFESVIQSIISHLKILMVDKKANKIKYILMVGGFSESQLLQQAIRAEFEKNGLKVLVPSEAQLAIIRGAVLYGHHQQEIGSRVAKVSYGLKVMRTFDSTIHSRQYKETIDGIDRCTNIFSPLVSKGDDIDVHKQYKTTVTPSMTSQTFATAQLYVKERNPVHKVHYVDEDDISKLGEIKVDIKGKGLDRKVEICFTFGGTEIKVDATDLKSKKRASTTIAFSHN